MPSLLASVRLVITTMLICVVGYTALILLIGQVIAPDTANGSLITASGDSSDAIVGSRLIAQKFERPEYFWPRPSAVDYNGAGAGGSNKSPTSTDVTDRAREIVAKYGATESSPLPPELAAASGGGLDPHITEHAAIYQVTRVAAARGVAPSELEALIAEHAFSPGGPFTSHRIVNVLELNIALDALPAEPR